MKFLDIMVSKPKTSPSDPTIIPEDTTATTEIMINETNFQKLIRHPNTFKLFIAIAQACLFFLFLQDAVETSRLHTICSFFYFLLTAVPLLMGLIFDFEAKFFLFYEVMMLLATAIFFVFPLKKCVLWWSEVSATASYCYLTFGEMVGDKKYGSTLVTSELLFSQVLVAALIITLCEKMPIFFYYIKYKLAVSRITKIVNRECINPLGPEIATSLIVKVLREGNIYANSNDNKIEEADPASRMQPTQEERAAPDTSTADARTTNRSNRSDN